MSDSVDFKTQISLNLIALNDFIDFKTQISLKLIAFNDFVDFKTQIGLKLIAFNDFVDFKTQISLKLLILLRFGLPTYSPAAILRLCNAHDSGCAYIGKFQ